MLSSWPLEVLTKIRSPYETGDEFARLCGSDPTSSIMSNRQTISALVSPVSFRRLLDHRFPCREIPACRDT